MKPDLVHATSILIIFVVPKFIWESVVRPAESFNRCGKTSTMIIDDQIIDEDADVCRAEENLEKVVECEEIHQGDSEYTQQPAGQGPIAATSIIAAYGGLPDAKTSPVGGGGGRHHSCRHEEGDAAAEHLVSVTVLVDFDEYLSSRRRLKQRCDTHGADNEERSTYHEIICQSFATNLCHGDSIWTNMTGLVHVTARSMADPLFVCLLQMSLRQWNSQGRQDQLIRFQTYNQPPSSLSKLQLLRNFSFTSCRPSGCRPCNENRSASERQNSHRPFRKLCTEECTGSDLPHGTSPDCTSPNTRRHFSSDPRMSNLHNFPRENLTPNHTPEATRTSKVFHRRILNLAIILIIVSSLVLKENGDKEAGKRSLIWRDIFIYGKLEDSRKKAHRNKSDLDILSEIISPPWRADAAFTCLLSKLARQVSVVVRPQTRFLPDTTNNPALDLAHVGYRLATLSALPPSVPVSRIQLADAGFYYRGQGDELICHKCQKRYSGWTSQDKPMDVHRRISPDCPHIVEREREQWVLGRHDPMASAPSGVPQPQTPQRNEAFSSPQGASNSQREINVEDGDMANSRPSVPAPSAVHETPIGAAESGVTAGAREARPVPLSGAQETMPPGPSNSPSQQHSCSSLSPPAGENSAGSNQARATPPSYRPGLLGGAAGSGGEETPGPGSQPRQMFPRVGLDLGGAVYPIYQDMASRRRSFPHWNERRAPPLDQLILCGMFYAGYADCVRCFYCGVGLKHWEVNDDVWEEHVRWRPSCGYLRAVKGDDYIRRTLARLGREAGGETEDEPPRQNRHEGDHASPRVPAQPRRQDNPERQALPSGPPSGHTVRTASNTISSSAPSRAPAGNVSTQAATSTPTNAAARTTSSSSSSNTTSSTAASSSEISSNQNGARPEGGIASIAPRDETPGQRVARLQAENRELTRRLRCKVCLQEPIDTILMPCGHLVVCETCARNVTQCPLCRERIRATARVHMN